MGSYSAPPDQTGLVLDYADTLLVYAGGTATDTIINGGAEIVYAGGMSIGTTINWAGVEIVELGGTSTGTTINEGGVESVDATSTGTIINNGGVENVSRYGTSIGTIINNGGVEIVVGGASTGTTINEGGVEIVIGGTSTRTIINSGGVEIVVSGTADNVQFAGDNCKLTLGNPSGLTGTLTNWHVSDVIDLEGATVTSVNETGESLTVTYGNNQKVIYTLAGQEANTQVAYRPDGHGGTELILVPTTGVQSVHETGHHLFF